MTVSMNIPYGASEIMRLLKEAGHESFVVGGCVRDALLGREPNDWDITTSANVDEMKEAFRGYSVYETGIQHGTITVAIDGEMYETTTYRADGEYSDGRHPDEVFFVNTVEEDLARRDFTVNAIAYSPERGLVDPYNGQSDLSNKTIKAVRDPYSRFREDYLRVMRALRFAAVLGFTIEPQTSSAIDSCKDGLKKVAEERKLTEFSKMMVSKNVDGLAKILTDYAPVIFELIPDLAPCYGYDQPTPYHSMNVYDHIVETVRLTPPDLTLRIAALFHDIGKPKCAFYGDDGRWHCHQHEEVGAEMSVQALRQLRCDNDLIKDVKWLIEYHDYRVAPTGKSVKRLMNLAPSREMYDKLMLLKYADAAAHSENSKAEKLELVQNVEKVAQVLYESDACFKMNDLAVNGQDLMDIGYEQGRDLGTELKDLLNLVIDEDLPNEKDALLAHAKAKLEESE